MPVVTSSAPVGSSQSRTSGRLAMARAMATRCCSPPESWEVVHAGGEADQFERFLGGHRIARDAGDEGDVFAGGEAGNEVVKLEHEADAVAAKEGERFLLCTVERPAFVDEFTRGGDIQPAEDIEQGGFPAAGRTEQADEFAGIEFEVHVVQGDHIEFAGVIDFAHAAGFKNDAGGGGR